MRARYDENGNERSYHQMIFDNVPDDYEMQSVLTGEKFTDLSYVGIMSILDQKKILKIFPIMNTILQKFCHIWLWIIFNQHCIYIELL
jgi:hypothetical protein